MTGNKNKWIRLIGLFFTALLWMSLTVYAEESVSLEVSSTDLQMGMSTEITISIYDGLKVDKMSMTDYDAFEILGQRQSSSTQFINGKKSQMKQYILTVMPKEEGEFNLQVTVNDGKNDYQSETVKVTVRPKDTSLGEKAEDVFITTDVSKETGYLGQSIVVTYNLFTSYNIEGFEFSEPFSLDGAIVEEVPKEDLASNYLTIGDTKYIKYEAKKLIIHPIHAEDFEIPAYKFQVYVSTGDIFGSYKTRYLATEPVSIEIMPLPEAGRPDDFSGLVGRFEVTADYDKDTVDVGEPVTLSVSFLGEGNLEILDTLYKDEAEKLKLYETVGQATSEIQGDRVISQRSFEIIWIPQVNGEVRVPELTIPYFDTEEKAYSVLTVPGKVIQVTGEAEAAGDNSVTGNDGEKVVINQVTYPKDHEDDYVIYLNKGHLKLIVFGAVLLLVLVLLISWFRSDSHNDRALRLAKQKLKKATTPVDQYDIFADTIFEWTGCQLKAVSESDLKKAVSDPNQYQELQEISRYFEYKRFYEEMSLQASRAWLLDVLSKMQS